jgi:hypothetical protein
MIVAPIVWDGVGLLPGETISRYKASKPAKIEEPAFEEPTENEEFLTTEDPATFPEPSAIVGEDASVEDEELEVEETESGELKASESDDEYEVEESESVVHHAPPRYSFAAPVVEDEQVEETFTAEHHSHSAPTHESVSESAATLWLPPLWLWQKEGREEACTRVELLAGRGPC